MITDADARKILEVAVNMLKISTFETQEDGVIGNDDVLRTLETVMKLIDHTSVQTQGSGAIDRLKAAIPNAVSFLEDHPGGPPVLGN